MIRVGLSFISIVQDVLNQIFTVVLVPVLSDVLNIIITLIVGLISEALVKLVLQFWVVLLKLISFLEEIFNIFLGLSDIRVKDVSQGKGFLDYLFTLPEIQRAVMAITMISFALIFLVSIMAVLRSISDMALENKNPLSQVVRDSLKATLTIVLIPVICLFGLMIASNLLLVVHKEFNFVSKNSDISDLVFITAAGPHIKNPTKLEDYTEGHAYANVDNVMRDFHVSDFNYFLVFISSFFVLFIMFSTVIQSIMRIFIILLLYVVSPLIAAMMPLDGGKKFNDWKKMFLAYTMSAFAPLLSMKLYFMIMTTMFTTTPVVYSDSVSMNTVIEMCLVLGGAFAVYSSRNLLISLIDPSAAQTISASNALLSMGLKSGMGKVTGLITGGGGKQKGKDDDDGDSKEKDKPDPNQTQSQAYDGK